MDTLEALRFLSAQAAYEASEDVHCPRGWMQKVDGVVVTRARLPGGGRINLLKTLLTTACERDCNYCPFRAGRNFRRVTFSPEELARVFIALYRSGAAQGLFLSSGVTGGGMRTQDRLLETATILRTRLGYRGYLHLKIMPGVEYDQVEQAMVLADRISINLEAPNPERLSGLAPGKKFADELIQPLKWAHEIRQRQSPQRAWKGRWPSSTTQFVVGGMGETDLELLQTTGTLHRQVGLARAYYSPFRPVPGTPLENQMPSPLTRERRLYQASYLMRDYGFTLSELPFDPEGNLPQCLDPKLAWARRHLIHSPVEINHAGRSELMRVPGIGARTAEGILNARRSGPLKDIAILRRLGVASERAAPFLLIDGKKPPSQLAFEWC